MKLRKITLELSDNFKGKKGKFPWLKRWRIWCNGSYLGSILKKKKGEFVVQLSMNFIEDTQLYKPIGKKFLYQKDVKLPKKLSFPTLTDSYLWAKKEILKNINHIIK